MGLSSLVGTGGFLISEGFFILSAMVRKFITWWEDFILMAFFNKVFGICFVETVWLAEGGV
jgi:hypothetical protein